MAFIGVILGAIALWALYVLTNAIRNALRVVMEDDSYSLAAKLIALIPYLVINLFYFCTFGVFLAFVGLAALNTATNVRDWWNKSGD